MKKKLSYILDLLPNNKWLRNIILTIICLHVLMIFLYISLPEGSFKFFIGFLLSPLLLILYLSILIYPIVTTVINILYFRKKELSERVIFFLKINDLLTFILGVFLSKFQIEIFLNGNHWFDWQEQIYSYQRHSPIWTPATPTLITIIALSLVGYAILAYLSTNKTPPLLLVSGISLSYLGIIILIIGTVQLGAGALFGFWILTVNVILIYYRLINQTIINWISSAIEPDPRKKWRNHLYHFLQASFHWHVLAFFICLPILALTLMVLTLFGQEPDYIIKTWTNTSDWILSTKISPPSIEADEHYLCTVGASGHRSIVKPLRMGVRHGHRIVVNRQLLIANAFEQLLEEKMPRSHRFIRNNYDKYGYPIARHIKNAWQADVIYIFMKPAEWLFLLILYLVDVKPENRIALQYITKPDKKTA